MSAETPANIIWTPEQESVFSFGLTSRENGLVEALAGSAKSTTLVELSRRMIDAKAVRSILVVAFNKRIADEINPKLPPGAEAKTFHSHGFTALKNLLNGKVGKPNAQKRTKLLREYIQSEVKDLDEVAALQEDFNDLRDAIGFGAQAGWLPHGAFKNGRSLYASDDDFFDQLASSHDWSPPALHREVIREVSRRAIANALRGEVDFDDMLLIPATFPVSFPLYDLTLVDEAQDLSLIQHVMLDKMTGRKRVIAVGDSCQAIYGFRGAHEDSLSKLGETFKMERRTLSISFRCPVAVAEHVRWRAPHIQSPSWAKPGIVEELPKWDASSIPDGSAIICRNNAPLFSCALRLLRAGRKPHLMGNDIIKGLIRDMKSLSKDESIDSDECLRRLDIWHSKQLKKYNNSPRVTDKYECIRLFFEDQPTLRDAVAHAERIENMQGSITLCTGHKSKGLEWSTVFFLDQHLVGARKGEKNSQEHNLRYVICTRAKERLVYITSDGFVGPDAEAGE